MEDQFIILTIFFGSLLIGFSGAASPGPLLALSIKETLPIINNCDLVVSNDTGFAHIACALGVKTITLFMDSPVMTYGKYSSRIVVVEPRGEENTTAHDTMGKDKISFEEVLSKANEILS